MTTTLRLPQTQITFPPLCVVCAAAASHPYPIDKTFTFGRRAVLIQLPVPMCDEHYAQATSQSRGERWSERIGLIVGVLIGLIVASGLLVYWANTDQGAGIFNWLLAIFVGFSIGAVEYFATRFWLAPSLASSTAKAARHSVRLTKYWPAQNVVEVVFSNDQIAELVAHPSPAPRSYRLRAKLLCPDVRLNTRVETEVQLDHQPTLAEAEKLLWPVAEALVARYNCADCPYELSEIEVTSSVQ